MAGSNSFKELQNLFFMEWTVLITSKTVVERQSTSMERSFSL